jgi:hypothetical protein
VPLADDLVQVGGAQALGQRCLRVVAVVAARPLASSVAAVVATVLE